MSYRNDLKWMEYQGFKGLTKAEYKEALLKTTNINDGIQLAILDNDTCELIGDLYLKREDDICWIGYTIAPQKARQGYTHEVVSATMQELAIKGVKTFKAGVLAQNSASIALLNKLCFVFDCVEDDEQIFVKVL